jgi:CheY-like chemotaxis protein
MQLGDVHGVEVFGRLRSMPGMEAVPFIALTADAFAESRDQALALGFIAYWSKPIDLTRMVDEIMRATGQLPQRNSS